MKKEDKPNHAPKYSFHINITLVFITSMKTTSYTARGNFKSSIILQLYSGIEVSDETDGRGQDVKASHHS